MKAALKQKWIDALRSGKYMQGRYRLRNNFHDLVPKFCCLGVLCEVAGVPRKDDGYTSAIYPYVTIHSLSKDLTDKFHISTAEEGTLIAMNDELYKTFAEIADYIEENL